MKLLVLVLSLSAFVSADGICDVCLCSDVPGGNGKKIKKIECNTGTMTGIIQEENDWPDQLQFNVTPTTLIDVSFDHNIIVKVHPLPAVPIVRFSATHNHIVAIEDGAFLKIAETIEEINLDSNRLTSSLQPHAFRGDYAPKSLQPLPKVRILRLARNAFHSLHPDLFEHLPALEELYLDFNPIQVLDSVTVKAIATVTKLKVLSLSGTGLKTLPETFLHTPRFLEFLDISGNDMRAVPATVGDAKELRTLILDDNPIRHFRNDTLPFLPKLTKLSISRMPELISIEDRSLSGLSSLRELHCEFNYQLEFIDTYAMGTTAEGEEIPLTTLILNNNHLSYLTRHLVYRWDKLENVTLYGNPWSCDCVNQWMVTDLGPILEGIDPDMMKKMICHEPEELRGMSMNYLQMHAPHLRCLDAYGNHPENDSGTLIGILIGSVVAIPFACAMVYLWRKRDLILAMINPRYAPTSGGRFAGPGAAEFSRAFYKRAGTSSGDI